ncbi:MAG: type III-B CRISPR module-associated protein Cmr5 [Saprospiraceae bacterium]
MESTINLMLPHAIHAIGIKEKLYEGSKIKSIYESYLSQFGPMAIQIGLRSTLAVYKNKSGSSQGTRMYILDLIYDILTASQILQAGENSSEKWVNNLLSSTMEIDSTVEQKILDASVALKRAIRTFLLTDNKPE